MYMVCKPRFPVDVSVTEIYEITCELQITKNIGRIKSIDLNLLRRGVYKIDLMKY